MTGKKPDKLDEVAGGVWAGAKRAAQRWGAAAGEKIGHTTDIQVQDARAILSREVLRHIKNVAAGGTQVSLTYANVMDYLRQRYNYVPDDMAQSAIMQFMKKAGNERLAIDPQDYQKILQTLSKDSMSVEVANAARAYLANPEDKKTTAALGRVADQLGKKYSLDGLHVAKAYVWKLRQMNGEQQDGGQQQAPSGAQSAAQQSPNDANAQAQHPNNQGSHPVQESFEVLARRLLNEHNEFEFAAAALLLEDMGQDDDLYQQAVEVARKYGDNFTTAKLQRDMGVSYQQAAELVQKLEQNKVVSPVDPRTKTRTVLQPKSEPNEWDTHPDGQEGEEDGEQEAQGQPEAAPAQDAANQAQQSAEAPGATNEPAQPQQGAQDQNQNQMNQRDASASRWKNSIEPGLPNKNVPLNRSQFDKLMAIVASDLVRRNMFSYGKNRDHNGVLPADKQQAGTDGSDSVLTSSGSRFDIKKFEKTLADASVSPDEIAAILKRAKNSENVRDAEEAIMRSGNTRQAAAAIAAAFGRAFKPSAGWGQQ